MSAFPDWACQAQNGTTWENFCCEGQSPYLVTDGTEKIARIARKMTCEKKVELSAEVRYFKFTSTEKSPSNLLLTGFLHVVHAFKMREGICLFLGNICFIPETSKSLHCLDNSTCQGGNSFEVLYSRPFPEPGPGKQTQEKKSKPSFRQCPYFCCMGLPFASWDYLGVGVRPFANRVCRRDDARSAGEGDVSWETAILQPSAPKDHADRHQP